MVRWAALGLVLGLLAPLVVASPAAAAPGDITTWAGGDVGDGGAATEALLAAPAAVAVDAAGNIYIDDAANSRIRKVDTSGVITTIAGTGIRGYTGDGGPATAAKIGTDGSAGIAVDGAGNVYFAAVPGVRKVDANGIITTFAGNGTFEFSGDGGPATSASVFSVQGLALDRFGNLFVSDAGHQRVRKVDTSGIITTVAGNGTQDFSGDGGPATQAALNAPEGLAFDAAGDLLITVQQSSRIRKVVPGADGVIDGGADEIITTIAGSDPIFSFGGDGGPATSAQLSGPTGVAVDGAGNIYISDTSNGRVRRIDPNGIITTFAGVGGAGFSGDGGPAVAAQFNQPAAVAVDPAGNVVIVDAFPGAPSQGNNRVRRVDATTGVVTTIAGGGEGDGRPATQAALSSPYGITVNGASTYITENAGNRVRKVGADGTIASVAGGGTVPLGDGGPATAATINSPAGVALDSQGNLFVVDTGNGRVREITPNGTITTVAGGGAPADGVGDNGPATAAKFNYPVSVTVDTTGNLFVGDAGSAVVRKVAPNGIITTVAGTGKSGFSGDGGPATAAQISTAYGVAVDAAGNLFIADTYNHRIRRVDASTGVITTVAGNGTGAAPSGDGGPASGADIPYPLGVSIDSAGNLYTASEVYSVVRKIVPGADGLITGAADETISTVAGGGTPADGVGDGGPATDAMLNNPFSAVVDSAGNLLIADANGYRIRKVTDGTISTLGGTGTAGFGGDGGLAVAAQIDYSTSVAVDPAGNVFVADQGNDRIRRIDANGIITTFAGGGVGDGLVATSISLNRPRGVAADDAGNVYVAECGTSRVRKVDAATGIISTYAGGGIPADGVGDGAQATAAGLACPTGLYLVPPGGSQPAGTLFIADCAQFTDLGRDHVPVADPAANRVRKVDPSGTITTIAGTDRPGFTGDGGPAIAAQLNCPSDIRPDAGGNLFIADRDNNRVRRIDNATGIITTVAGDGANGFATGGNPKRAHVNNPTGVAVDTAGDLLIAENSHARVTKVNAVTNKITTFAGQGVPGFGGDGGPATLALLSFPTQLAVDAGGNVLITDGTILSGLGGTTNNRVRKVEAGKPQAVHAGCGRTITHDTKLVADVGPCPGDGIIVGRDNVTLDLNGHKVLGAGPGDGTHPGIRLTQRKGVTVTNGTVSGFAAGIAVMGGSHNTVSKMKAVANHGPPPNLQAEFGDGIILLFSSDNLITRSTIAGNGPYDGIAMEGLQTNNNTVRNNTVRDNNGRGIITSAFFDGSLPGRGGSVQADNVIDNKVLRNAAAGISNLANQNALISGNDVEKNGLATPDDDDNGIGVQALQNSDPITSDTVENNTVHGNGGNGIVIPNSHRNHISNNDAADNAKLYGNDLADYTYDPDTFENNCTDNVWFNNTWGSGFYYPDCTAAGGTGPTPPPPAAAGGQAAAVGGKASVAKASPANVAPPAPRQRHLAPADEATARGILGVR